MYEVEIPLFQKPPQCTVKINPAILKEKLKRNQVTTFETYLKSQSRMKNESKRCN